MINLDNILLLVAVRRPIDEANASDAFARFAQLLDYTIDEELFAAAVARAVSAGLLYDPVRLPRGALQCEWRLEATPAGVAAVCALVREWATAPDELIKLLTKPDQR
jgi:hypothetical protein